MPDKAVEFLEQMLDQRLKDITQELHNLTILLEGYAAAVKKDAQMSDRLLSGVKQAQQALATTAPTRFLSGRWPLRDGDSYGNVAPQPAMTLAEPDGANGSTRDLRSTDER